MLLLCLVSHWTVHTICEETQRQLDDIRAAADSGDFREANQRIDALLFYFSSQQHWLELLLKRETVASLSINLHGLHAYANADSAADLYTEIDKAIEQTSMMRHLFLCLF